MSGAHFGALISGFGKVVALLLIWLCKPRLSHCTPPLPPSLLPPAVARTQLLSLCQLLTSVFLMPPPPCSWWEAVLPDGDCHLKSLDLKDFTFPLPMPMKLPVGSFLPWGYCWNKRIDLCSNEKGPSCLLTGFKTFPWMRPPLNEHRTQDCQGMSLSPWAGEHWT